MGILQNTNGFEYVFGFLSTKHKGFQKLSHISISKSEFNDLVTKRPNISFKATFGDKEYEIDIKDNDNSLANDLTINGVPGIQIYH